MKDSQEDKLTMYEAVLALLGLALFLPMWSVKPAIVTAKTFIENAIQRLRLYRLIQEKDNKGLTVIKKKVQLNLITAVLKLIDGLIAYATSIGDQALLDSINYTKSDLTRARDNILVDISRLIYTTAEPLAHELDDFEVAEADIAAVDNLITQYEIAIPAKRITVAQQKVATQNIGKEVKAIDLYFQKTFDNLMIQFRTSQPDFYAAYKNARIIINTGKRTKVAKAPANKKTIYAGTIINAVTGLPESGVTVTLVETGQTMVTGSDGKFSFILKTAGAYSLKAEKKDFTTWNEDTTLIQAGTQINLEIELEPIEVPAES
jgi:hypothetical protein